MPVRCFLSSLRPVSLPGVFEGSRLIDSVDTQESRLEFDSPSASPRGCLRNSVLSGANEDLRKS